MINIFLLLGTVIGAGIFSLPIALQSIGFLLYLVLILIIAYFMANINYFYRQVVERIQERHQLPGYTRLILGKRYGVLATFLLLFSVFGALVAYLILSGQFLSALIPISPMQGSWLFYLVVVGLLFFTGKSLEIFDVYLTVVKALLLFAVIVVSFFVFQMPSNGLGTVFFDSSSISASLVAYGSILFALTGYSIVPELKKQKQIKKSIFSAQIIIALIYLLFALGVSPYFKNQQFVFPNQILHYLFNLAGFFCVLTPYLMLSWVVYDLFNKDLKFKKKDSLLLTVVIPMLLFLFGVQNFMNVIAITGGLFLGGIAILISQMYQKKFPGKHVFINRLIQVVFLLGIVAELVGLI